MVDKGAMMTHEWCSAYYEIDLGFPWGDKILALGD